MFAGIGDDLLVGASGGDVDDGGEGTDTARKEGAAAGLRASLSQPAGIIGDNSIECGRPRGGELGRRLRHDRRQALQRDAAGGGGETGA